MSFIELFLIAVSLAMDAFAVSVSNGLILPNVKKEKCCYIWSVLWFISVFYAYNRLFFR